MEKRDQVWAEWEAEGEGIRQVVESLAGWAQEFDFSF